MDGTWVFFHLVPEYLAFLDFRIRTKENTECEEEQNISQIFT